MAIAAGVLSMTLGVAPASAASAVGSAGMVASGTPAANQPAVDGKAKGHSQGKGNKHRFELPIDWFHLALGSVHKALRGVASAGE